MSNYSGDEQPSMQRFATMLHGELATQGITVDILRPPSLLAGNGVTAAGAQKWLGYADKFLLYPPRLRSVAHQRGPVPTVVHICDHSNAMYVPWIRRVPHVVTCHDLLAVRRALGEFSGQRTRWSGRRLQQMILRGLRQADCIISDSESTQKDVQRLVGGRDNDRVIHPAVSRAFTPQPTANALERLARLHPGENGALCWPPASSQSYILHVGGNQWYKNRAGVIDIYAALIARMSDAPRLVLAGKPLTRDVTDGIRVHSLQTRVSAFSNVSDEDLAALYSSAALLLFPSLAEGFGWPVLEALACGCRVVASRRAPITEVAADAATYIDPENPTTAAATVEMVLREPDGERQARVTAGLSRAARFSSRAMANAYLAVYQDALQRQPSAA